MHILSIILFALTSNIDNFTVGIAYGIKKIKVGTISNLLIAFITALGTFISMSLGLVINNFISNDVSNILGSLILIFIGLWFVKDFFTNKSLNTSNNNQFITLLSDPEKADMDNSGYIDIKESLTLAFSLAINNLGLGIGASITGLNAVAASISAFVFSILTISLGSLIGNSYLSRLFGKYASLISGLVIIILGIYEIII
ncbi:sporulation membrane protein YtaF [Clostridium sp. 19966]|uniref:sporulation membrane protein YtaF n=1 Tax=Clostridium sp. 19966 TaxID=2768166 RepID=UPI0028DFD052|nr:sporulation membrane protein YtaF [Clostridium sp. 19966]MDT8715988.1 sporulation membrane protein YtaF [Clostridium sp. 19966]